MKINFDWHNYMSKGTDKTSTWSEESKDLYHIGKTKIMQGNAILDLSESHESDFLFGNQAMDVQKFGEAGFDEQYLTAQRDFITLMSNSMSASDFQKFKEEGYDLSSMEPDQMVTILDKIKTVLAQSGTCIQGYNDNLSVDILEEIAGTSGYAEAIAKELSLADAPVTEENIKKIDALADQALTMNAPGDGSLVFMVSQKMQPTMENLYKAEHSSRKADGQRGPVTGYASNPYSRQGMDTAQIRRTTVSEEEYRQLTEQVKNRIESDGLEVTEETLGNGLWLLEKGLPVTGENIQLLEEIKDLSFPLDIKQVIRQGAKAIGEGKSPFAVNLNKKDEGIYKEAADICRRFGEITYQAVDRVVNQGLKCTLENLEKQDFSFQSGWEQLSARKTLEEVRLKMTVEANVKLLQSGYQIETAPMEELIEQLDRAAEKWNEELWGKEDAGKKAELFAQTGSMIKELPSLPLSVVGKIPFMEKATLTGVVQEGRNLQQQYTQARDSYETIMTAPRADLGDNIKKAFRNVDDILQDMDLEINDANRRAIRIMGYNQITITEDNLERIKEADRQVRTVIDNLKPGMTLRMIREGKNPLEMSMEEMQDYITEHENEFINDSDKFSEFLYKLEKKNGISEAEREAYIGVYRLFRQIEKSDGAVVGSLLNQNAEVSFQNLLSAVRTKKAKPMDVKVDDMVGTVSQVERRSASISEQIEKGIASVQETLTNAGSVKTPEILLKEIRDLQQDTRGQKEFDQVQMEEIRDILKETEKEQTYLETYHQPVTLDNLQSSRILNQKRGYTFKKAVQIQDELAERGLSSQEENILKEAGDFLSAVEQEDHRGEMYENMISHTKQILEQAAKQDTLHYLDVKELQSVYKQLSAAAGLAKEENYEIPVQIGEEVTSINLKIVQGTEDRREVKITLQTENLGKVEARFVETPDGLEGSVLTDHMDGKDLLESHSEDLQKALNEVLKETKTELKSLFFGVHEKLNIDAPEKGTHEKNTDISLLYKTAKEFIYYVKGIKEA